MTRYLAQFRLKTLLRIPEQAGRIEQQLNDRTYIIANDQESDIDKTHLKLSIIFIADNIDIAHDFGGRLADDFSYSLSFLTGAAVRVERPIFLIDWEPGVEDRTLYSYFMAPFADPVDCLDGDLLSSTLAVGQALSSGSASVGLRW